MCRYILFYIILLSHLSLFGQEENTLLDKYSILQSSGDLPLNKSDLMHLTRTVIYGIQANQENETGILINFGIKPVATILEEKKIEGMQQLQVVKMNTTLQLWNLNSKSNIAFFTLITTGSGQSTQKAINQAIENITTKGIDIKKGLNDFELKIKNYYRDNCDELISETIKLQSEREYEKAFMIVSGIPLKSECGEKASKLKTEIYNLFQTNTCSNLLKMSDEFQAKQDFESALNQLSMIDSESPCKIEAKSKILDIEKKYSTVKSEKWSWLFKFWTEGAEIEKQRLRTFAAIYQHWLSQQIKLVR
jgi:hypothetical protein